MLKKHGMRFYSKLQIHRLSTFKFALPLLFTVGFFIGSSIYPSQSIARPLILLYPSTVPGTHLENNVIISVSLDMPFEIVYRFARSARTSCSTCHIILFLHSKVIAEEIFQQLAIFYSITYIPYDMWMPPDTYVKWPSIGTASLRWIIISQYLKHIDNMRTGYKYVFICDSRDVVFQRNIFDNVNRYEEGLFAFQETIKITIKKCSYNSKWIRDCYGEAELDRIGNRSVICAGTILGSWRAIIDYLSLVEQITKNRYRQCNDQGIHNHIVHVDGVNNTKIHIIPHETGFVGTVGSTVTYTRNQFGLILNEKGQVYAVVHQFDRCKPINDQLEIEYQLWHTHTQL
jgi:hypothetical protein